MFKNTKAFILILPSVLLLNCGKYSSQQEQPSDAKEEIIENTSGSTLAIGRGFNSHSQETRGQCVENGNLVYKGYPSQMVSYELKEIQSFDQLSKSMSIHAAGKFGSGIYGGSASFSYFESSDFTAYSSYLMVHVKVINSDRALETHRLKDWAQQLYHQEGEQAFFEACGDGFVSQQTEGGEFFAIVEFRAKSEEHKKDVQTKIRASGGSWSFAGNFHENLKELSKIAETEVKMIRVGGRGALPGFGNPGQAQYDDLLAYSLRFPEQVAPGRDQAWVTHYTVEDYGIVPNFVIPSPNLLTQKSVIERLGEKKFTLRAIDNQITYILRNSNEFFDVNESLLQQASNQITRNLNLIRIAAQKCLQNPFVEGACQEPENLTLTDITWPEWEGTGMDERFEYARRWGVFLGIITEDIANTLRTQKKTIYYKSQNPRSGFQSIGDELRSREAMNFLPLAPPY